MSYETDHLRDTIRTAIGYELVPLSIRDHPEITKEFRTAEDADGLVDRIEAALRAEGYIRMAALTASDEEDFGPTEELPSDHEMGEIYARHLLGGRFSTKELHDRFHAWLNAHDDRVRADVPSPRENRIIELSNEERRELIAFLERPNGASRYFGGRPFQKTMYVEAVEGGGVWIRLKPESR